MKRDIHFGGEFEFLPSQMTFSDKRNIRLLRSGRAAFRYILEIEGPNQKVLMPAYTCDSLLIPLFELQISFDFYHVSKNLSVDTQLLLQKIKESKATMGLFINYFGFPCLSEEDIIEIKSEFPDFKIVLDFTHGSLLEFKDPYNISFADYYFSSLRKYTFLPDGCFVGPIELKSNYIAFGAHDLFYNFKVIAKNLRAMYLSGLDIEEGLFINLSILAEKELDKSSSIDYASNFSSSNFNSIDFALIAKKRRKNYERLHHQINTFSSFSFIYNLLPTKISPFALPILFEDKDVRDRVRQALIKKKVFCPILWPLLKEINGSEFPASKYLADSILCLPIDQRYNEKEMEILGERFSAIINKI